MLETGKHLVIENCMNHGRKTDKDVMKSYFSVCSSKLFWLKEMVMHPCLNRLWIQCQLIDGYSRSELERLRDEKLKHVLLHAATTVPYYRKYFLKVGVDPTMVTLNDFPIIEKKDIRGHEEEFFSTAKGMLKVIWVRTSGSTGEPFKFGRSEFDYSYAAQWRGLLRFGIRPGDKRALVKGVDITTKLSFKTRICRWAYGLINRCIVIDAHFLARNEANIIRELNRLVTYRPKYLHGYVSSIYLLALTAEKHNINLASLKVKAVVTESEKCHSFQRELIERVFAAPVVENYGCVEFGMIAQPARDGVLCVNEDHVLAEATSEGSVAFTNLDEFAFPLIRFKNGDELKLGDRHPTLPYQTIVQVAGRKTETIKLVNGGSVHGFVPMYPMYKHSKWMKAYQIYQPELRTLIIRIVLSGDSLPVDVHDQILSEMREIVGNEVDVRFEILKDIPLTKRGKRLFVVSDVK